MERLTLKQMILNKIDAEPKGYAEELAKISGSYASGSNLKKVLKDDKKEFEQLQGLIKIVEYIWGLDEVKMIVKYSHEVATNKEIARNLLEYLAVYREFQALNNLLDRMENCKNSKSNEWARVYRMQYKYELSNTSEQYHDLLKELGSMNINLIELEAYKKMLMTHCLSLLGDFTLYKILSDEIKNDIELIDNDFIKESYTIRFSEVMSDNYLRVYNDPITARKYTDKIISSNSKGSFKAYAYFVKGFSYLFTSYDETMKYLTKSMELYKSLNRIDDVNDLMEQIEFASIYWNKFDEDHCKCIKNEILLMIKKGNDVSNYLVNNKEKVEPEFYLYLEGINSNNDKKLRLSLIKYIKKNDLFLANLAKIELLKNGEDEEFLQELISINV